MAAKKKSNESRKKKAVKSATFRLPENILEQLASEAEAQERSQTTLVKRALEAYLAQQAEEDRD